MFDALKAETHWQQHRCVMYEREVFVPRLIGAVTPETNTCRLLHELGNALGERYGCRFGSIGLAYYRDGQDSVAMHGDKLGARIDSAVVAILALDYPRTFLLRAKSNAPKTNEPTRNERKPNESGPRRALSFRLGRGDLLVMGGSCQRDFEHGVPKAAHAEGRISVVFRE